ncbi:TPA: fimbrial protein [Shewanella algae]|uniref:fimbrial protein n=1 Tax=Shewanella algae TaxID=38313 RepID=UPI001C58A9B3|nr:fimbrial protein [Shewanella algae]HDS1202801.1 fimbrial protein [Shewanella algae]
MMRKVLSLGLVLLGSFSTLAVKAECVLIGTPSDAANAGLVDSDGYIAPSFWALNTVVHAPGYGRTPITAYHVDSLQFQPAGSLLVTSGSVPPELGLRQRISDPEHILYACEPSDSGQIFEAISIPARDDDLVVADGVPDNVYGMRVPGVGVRARNETTGEQLTNRWRFRALSNLDVASNGKLLIKPKNFSSLSFDLLRIPMPFRTTGGGLGTANYNIYSYHQTTMGGPVTYVQVALSAPGVPFSCVAGSENGYNYHQSYQRGCFTPAETGWDVGGLTNPINTVAVTRNYGCYFESTDPVVSFPPISASELLSGQEAVAEFSLIVGCEDERANADPSMTKYGISPGENALGFKVSTEAYQLALSKELTTSAGGVTRLLSVGYGTDPDIATNVGIRLERGSGENINFLSGEATGGGNLAGWYAVDPSEETQKFSYLRKYVQRYTAHLTILEPNVKPTPGKVYATAEILVRMQ